jgi:hypothetical protein
MKSIKPSLPRLFGRAKNLIEEVVEGNRELDVHEFDFDFAIDDAFFESHLEQAT